MALAVIHQHVIGTSGKFIEYAVDIDDILTHNWVVFISLMIQISTPLN